VIDKVLETIAFARVPKRGLKAIFVFACIIATMLVSHASFAVGTTPKITRIETKDLNGDGFLDAVTVTFDTIMDTGVSAPNGFSVVGFESGTPASQWLSNAQLQVNLTPRTGTSGDTGLRPAVVYDRAVATQKAKAFGSSGEEVETQSVQPTSPTIVDGAGPVLMSAKAKDFGATNIFTPNSDTPQDELQFYFSEPVKVAGATAAARIANLELAVKFSALVGGVCNGDAQETSKPAGSTNFPSLKTGSTLDPIVEPTASGPASAVVRVKLVDPTAHNGSTIKTPAIPGGCGVGIDQTGAANITDSVAPTPNNAVHQDFGATNRYRREIGIATTNLLYVNADPGLETQDLAPNNGDGYIDAIAVRFEHSLDDATVTDALKSKFSVKSGSQNATIASVTTGATGDSVLLVHVAGVQWGGGVRPVVSFDGSDCLLKAHVPAGASYRACADSFGGSAGIQSLDKVPPAIIGSVALDNDTNGLIDTIRIDVTEPVIGSATQAGWTVAGQPATGMTGQNTSTLRLAVTESLGTGSTPAVAYDQATGNTTDVAGAPVKSQTFDATDGAAPQVVKATSLSSGNNAATDRVTIEFSEPVNAAELDAAAFEVDGVPASGFGSSALDSAPVAGDKLVTITVAKDGTGHVGLSFAGSIADVAGNANTDGFTLAAPEVIDGAKPFVTGITTTPASPFGTGTVSVTATFSEPLDANIAPVVKFGDADISPVADGDHTNGFRNTARHIWDGTVTLTSEACEAQNGCASSITLTGGKDTVGNVQVDATPVAVVADTVAPFAPTGLASAAQQEAGAIAIAQNRIGSKTRNITVTAAITPGQLHIIGQATGGSAELLLDDEPFGSPVEIAGIDANASTITLTTAFADPAALQSAISEGTHTLSVNLCDSAGNCTVSEGLDIVADYSPVNVTLAGPHAGSFAGGDTVCIQWTGDEAGNDFTAAELRYSTNGGTSFPHLIASNLGRNGALGCGVEGGGYLWTIPEVNTGALRVQVSTIDGFGNSAAAQSASNMTVESITQTVITVSSTPDSLVAGAGTYMTGFLTGNDDGVGGKTITIQRRIWGTNVFESFVTATTDSNGRFAYYFKPDRHAEYRAIFNGDGPYLASTSAPEQVWVAVAVASRISSTSLQRGQWFQINGWVLPAHPGKQVWFQAYLGGTWVTVAKQTLTSRNYYQFWYRSTSPRSLLFRVAFPTQDRDHAWNISQRYMVAWK